MWQKKRKENFIFKKIKDQEFIFNVRMNSRSGNFSSYRSTPIVTIKKGDSTVILNIDLNQSHTDHNTLLIDCPFHNANTTSTTFYISTKAHARANLISENCLPTLQPTRSSLEFVYLCRGSGITSKLNCQFEILFDILGLVKKLVEKCALLGT